MHFNELFGQEETQSRSCIVATRSVNLTELLKYALEFGRIETSAGVDYVKGQSYIF